MSRRQGKGGFRTGRLLALLALAAVTTMCLRNGRVPVYAPLPEVLHAIRVVETGDRSDPPDGDGGLAIGPYQIHEVYWRDALAHDPGLGGTYQDCRDRAYAERVVHAYMTRYVPEAWALGDAEVIARTHNGGPLGMEKVSTEAYWQRVLQVLRPSAR